MRTYIDVEMPENEGVISESVRIKCLSRVPIQTLQEKVRDFIAVAVNEVDRVVRIKTNGLLKICDGIITYEIPGETIESVGFINDGMITFNLDGSDEGSLEVDLQNLVDITDEMEKWIKV